jgi:hypothetical protein
MSNINSYKSIVQVKKLLKVNDSRFEDRLNYLISEQAKLKQSIWPLKVQELSFLNEIESELSFRQRFKESFWAKIDLRKPIVIDLQDQGFFLKSLGDQKHKFIIHEIKKEMELKQYQVVLYLDTLFLNPDNVVFFKTRSYSYALLKRIYLFLTNLFD